ncbi:PREDICTED: cytochrome P450 4V2-like [Dinoponera quadriceps]|uniref:Cytochrome P450 4V2-like n=1 Tax=Dinoponera quadriceps TaxID=609295 RepID=A0A6P3YC13_DINQU|nr:PREDICTED: cytochrome P450 4V2-like [Dinoponera quadriceps]
MDKYYPINKIWGLHIPIVSIRHPDDLEVILNNTKNIEKSIIYKILIPWLNTGLLTSGGNVAKINIINRRIYEVCAENIQLSAEERVKFCPITCSFQCTSFWKP